MTRTLFSVTGLILVCKLLGFVKQMVVASAFGATVETDLINLSQGFVGDLQYLLVQSLTTSLVSLYIYASRRGEDEAKRLAGDTLAAFTLVAAGIAAAVAAAAPWLSRLIAPSYTPALSARLSGYLRLYAPVLVLFVWAAVFHALLTAGKRFIPGEMMSLNQSLLLMLTVLALGRRLGTAALTLGFFLYTAWNALYLGALSRRSFRLSRGNPFANPAVRQLLRMMGPLLLGYSLVYVNQLVDKILVSGLESGAVTALGYGAVLSNLVTTFIASFGSILFSYVTTRIAAGDHGGAAALTNRAALAMTVVFLPVSVVTALCARDIVTIAFARGAFSGSAVDTAAAALRGYAFCFVPLVAREVYSRFQYGYQDSRRPMVNSSVGIVVNIALSVALCPRFGVLGVTAASSVSVAVCGALNMVTARRKNTQLRYGPLARALILPAAAGAACALAGRWGLNFWAGETPLVRFVLVALCSLGVYFLLVSPVLWRLLRQFRREKAGA